MMKKWIFPILSTFTAAVISIITYDQLPERMAVHFNSSETPDNWMDKPYGAFLLPAIILFVSFIVWIGVKLEKNENKRLRAEATIGYVMAIVSVLMLAVHILIISHNLGYEIAVATFTTIIVGVTFTLLGNLLPRLPQGSMQWPKLSEPVRRKVSRFQGRMMMILGIVFILLALLPNSYILPIFFLLLTIFIITLVSSTLHFTRSEK